MSDYSSEFEQAIQRFTSGDKLGAENLLRQAASDAKFLRGQQSRQFARASYELATMLNEMGRKQDAVQAMREAASVNIPDDYQVSRNRLTYLTDLGAMLSELGEIKEANTILRQSLTARGDFYGTDHSGYAFGLEPLAVLTMNAGHLPEALKMIHRTISIFWKDGHPRVATAFPWRAMILKRMEDPTPPFAGLEDVPDAIMKEMVEHVQQVICKDHAAASQAIVFDFLQVVQARYGSDHEFATELQTILTAVQGWIGPSEGRIESLERLARSLLKQRKVPQAIEALLALASAFSDLKDQASAVKVYQQALKIAKQVKADESEARVLRNYGLYCAEIEKSADAEKLLRMSVAAAKKADDTILFGRCLIALGIRLQHTAKLEEAERLLKVGIRSLPAGDPDAMCGNSHLQAILTGDPCPCGDPAAAFADALRQHLLESLPRKFVRDVFVEVSEEGIEVKLDYVRQLNDSEKQELERAMDQANIEFEKKFKRDH